MTEVTAFHFVGDVVNEEAAFVFLGFGAKRGFAAFFALILDSGDDGFGAALGFLAFEGFIECLNFAVEFAFFVFAEHFFNAALDAENFALDAVRFLEDFELDAVDIAVRLATTFIHLVLQFAETELVSRIAVLDRILDGLHFALNFVNVRVGVVAVLRALEAVKAGIEAVETGFVDFVFPTNGTIATAAMSVSVVAAKEAAPTPDNATNKRTKEGAAPHSSAAMSVMTTACAVVFNYIFDVYFSIMMI